MNTQCPAQNSTWGAVGVLSAVYVGETGCVCKEQGAGAESGQLAHKTPGQAAKVGVRAALHSAPSGLRGAVFMQWPLLTGEGSSTGW